MNDVSSCDLTIKQKVHKNRFVLLACMIVFFAISIFFIGQCVVSHEMANTKNTQIIKDISNMKFDQIFANSSKYEAKVAAADDNSKFTNHTSTSHD